MIVIIRQLSLHLLMKDSNNIIAKTLVETVFCSPTTPQYVYRPIFFIIHCNSYQMFSKKY